MPDVQRLSGVVDIQGVDQGVAALLRVAHAFDTTAASSAAALRQVNGFGTAAQGPQSAASGVTSLTAATQQYVQATRARASVDDQLEKAQLRLRLAQTDNAGRVSILRQQYEQLAAAARPLALSQDEITKRTIAATQAAIQLANAEKSVTREQQSQLQAAAGGVGRGLLDGIGAGGILGGLGIAGGVAVATRSIINLGTETADFAIKAQTIGTAYEAATRRAGFASDDLLKKLDAAARGTASDTDLMAASNRALALGVGQNAQQIADLLAIARQKGKDFGESTTQAFEDITTGLGRLSPRILDNLGIILDENKIYKEYADAIGVAEGKLSDQEKRQALVNDLIRNNTDLIAKNATANLDAADKIAAAQAREQAAKERLGQSSLPIRVGIENAAANVFELLTGKPQEDARKQVEALALSASSYEDYVKRINAAHEHLRAGFNVIPPQFTLQLTPEQFDQIRELARLGDMAGRTKDDFNGLPDVVQEAGKAAALTKDDYDRLGKSLQNATDQGLRPFKAAVDATKASLDAQKASTAAAKDTVDSISGALDKAKATYRDFASARLVEDQKYQQQLFDLDQQAARAERNLIEFKAPGAGLDQALAPIQQQIDATDASLKGYKSDLDEINSFVEDQTRVVQDATDAQKAYDDAVGSAKDNLSAQQDRLSALQDVYDHLGESIQSAKRDMDDLRHTALVGEGALDDKLFAMEQNIKRQQLVIDQARLRGAGKDEIKKLTEQLDRLRTAEDAARLAGELRYDKQHRALEQQGVPRDEKTLQDATDQIKHYQDGINQLADAQEKAGTAVDDQKARIRDAQFDLMDATAAQRDHTAAVDAEKATLEKLKESQTAISKQYDEQKTKLGDLKTLLETTTKDALKPFQDQIDDVARQASLAKIAEKLEIDPLKRKIEETTASTKLLTFQEIITGINDTNAVIAILEPRLKGAQGILEKEQDATKVLQGVYDGATKALSAEQTYFDNLKIGLEDAKNNALVVKDILGDLSTIQDLLNKANGVGNVGGRPGQQAPFTGGAASGAGPGYDANAINGVLAKAGSPLAGQGQFIIDMSLKYGIPVEVALAMWKVEGNYGTAGASVANKNPGNLRDSQFAAGTNGGFALFDSWKAGIEGFFDLLRHNTHGYDTDVDKYKGGDVSALLDLIKTYAPAGDNNNPQEYYNSVKDMVAQLLRIITNGGGTAATAAGGRAGVINNGTTADDPRPSQYGIDSVVPGATLGSTFDDWRDYNGNNRVDPNEAHYGLDLQIKNGTPVLAPLSLTDIYTGYYPDALRKGWWVTGNDQYGRQWYFGHMTAIFVKNGGSIAKGSTIGTVGMGHVHVQLKQEPGGPPIDPSAALDSAAASGAGPGAGAADPYTAQTAGTAYQPSRYSVGGPRYGQPIATGLNGVNAAIAGLLPNLDNLTKAVAGVDDAAAAASDGIVVATDAILDHIGYKNKDGAAQLGYLNQNGGLDAGAAGNWSKTPGDGMSVGGPRYGDPIATGTGAGMGFGDGWAKGIEDITPKIEDTTTTTLQQLQDDVLVPWQNATRDFFSGAGFGFIGAASEGINSAGNGLAQSAGNVGGAAGASLVGGLRGNLSGIADAVAAINAALAQVTKDLTATVHVVYDDPGAPGSTTGRFSGGSLLGDARSRGLR